MKHSYWQRRREISSIHRLAFQVAALPRTKPGWNQELHPSLTHRWQGSKRLDHSHCFSLAIGRELDQKRSSKHKPVPIWDADMACSGLTHHTIIPASNFLFCNLENHIIINVDSQNVSLGMTYTFSHVSCKSITRSEILLKAYEKITSQIAFLICMFSLQYN